MSAVDIDLELARGVLEFIREKERVTVDDVRAEFFPGEIGVPYLYLDQLTTEGHLWVVPAADDGPMAWTTADYAREHRGMEALRKHREEKAAKCRAKSHAGCDHPFTHAELKACREARREAKKQPRAKVQTTIDPELLEWVRDFIFQRETVSRAGVVQEFFPGESHTAQHYLSALKAKGLIESRDGGQTYEWAYHRDRSNRSFPPITYTSHADCTHPKTPAGRMKCRKSRGHSPGAAV